MKDDDIVGPLPAPTAPVAVFWDLENCHVPSGTEAAELVGHIFTALRQRGLSGVIHIQAYADTSILPVEVNSGLSSTGVHLLHVARGRKEASDKAILVDMVLWALDHPPPAHFLLISGDRDFSNVLHRLKFRQYNIMLATTLSAKPSLMSAASLVWDWAGLARGEQLDPVPKAKRQPVLSPPTSGEKRRPAYGQRDSWGAEENNNASYPQASTSRQTAPVRSASTGWDADEPDRSQSMDSSAWEEERESGGPVERKRSVPPSVKEKLGQIALLHPEGCSLGEVMQALRTTNFRINWVGMGYPNLLSLLKALPDQCTVDDNVRTNEGHQFTRIYPVRPTAATARPNSGAYQEEPESSAAYNRGYPAPSPRGSFGAEPSFTSPRTNGIHSPRDFEQRPPAPSTSNNMVRPRGPPGPPPPPYHSEQRNPGPYAPHHREPVSSAPPRVPPPEEFRTLVAVVWELQRQAGGQPPDQRQVISMLRNEHGELFASLGGYGPYETPFKYIEAAQHAGYLAMHPGPAPGSVLLALTSKAGEHAYDIPQQGPPPPPQRPSQPPHQQAPLLASPVKSVKPPAPEPAPTRPTLEPRVVISADPPEAEALTVPLPPVLLKGTAASLRRDLMAPTEANIRARVVQLMRPQSVMAGGTEVKQWFIPDQMWERAVKAALDEGVLVRSTAANRDILLPAGMPVWRFIDPHYVGGAPYSAAQWAALEESLRTAKGRAVVEGAYTRYAAARGLQQMGVLKDLALGQVIHMLQQSVRKNWIQPQPNWRPSRVLLAPTPATGTTATQTQAPPPSSTSTSAPALASKSPAPTASTISSSASKKEPPAWLTQLRKWLPMFLNQLGEKGFHLAALKGTFKQVSGIDISDADLREAGFVKFSQMLAAMPDVCTLHRIYYGTNQDYELHPAGWTPKPTPPSASPVVVSSSPPLPVSTFFPKEVGSQNVAAERSTGPTVATVKADMAQLLAELLPNHPNGINAGGIKILFAQRFGYQLNHEALGFPKLRDLLQALPASCRLTFHPYIMIHARTPAATASNASGSDGNADRKVWSPVKKGPAARGAASEGAASKLRVLSEGSERKADGGDDREVVGRLRSLSLWSIDGHVDGDRSGAFGDGGAGSAHEPLPVVNMMMGHDDDFVDEVVVVSEWSTATSGHEPEPAEVASTDVYTDFPVERPGSAPHLAEAPEHESPEAVPVVAPSFDTVRATSEPVKVLSWSPDSLATPVAETPDRKLVLPHETTAYPVKPAELRSRLAKEVHAIKEEDSGDLDKSSPVSEDSLTGAH